MSNIFVNKDSVYNYVEDNLKKLVLCKTIVDNARYHHNTTYEFAPSVIKHGILSMVGQSKLGIKNYSDDLLKLMSNTDSHINGDTGVSLSVVGLKDLYRDEFEYDPFGTNLIDFLITSDVIAYRTTTHYGNEYIAGDLSNDKIKSVDIRLLKHIDMLIKKDVNASDISKLTEIVEKYNYLIDIARTLKDTNLNIPIREMSEENELSLDIDKLADSAKILVRK